MNVIEKLESCNFECVAGPLAMSVDWEALKAVADLYVVTKRGQIVSHTSGKGGERFLVHTNEAEARTTANEWNREHYGGAAVCEVLTFLSYLEAK